MKIPELDVLTEKGKRYAFYLYRYNRAVMRVPIIGKYLSAFAFGAIVAIVLKEGEKYGNTTS